MSWFYFYRIRWKKFKKSVAFHFWLWCNGQAFSIYTLINRFYEMLFENWIVCQWRQLKLAISKHIAVKVGLNRYRQWRQLKPAPRVHDNPIPSLNRYRQWRQLKPNDTGKFNGAVWSPMKAIETKTIYLIPLEDKAKFEPGSPMKAIETKNKTNMSHIAVWTGVANEGNWNFR